MQSVRVSYGQLQQALAGYGRLGPAAGWLRLAIACCRLAVAG
jgi:hypothetical protein